MRLGILCEWSARQTIHMKAKSYFLWKIQNQKKKKSKMSSAAVMISTLWVNELW